MINSKKDSTFEEEYESLKSSKFKQQKFTGWRKVPSMLRISIFFFSIGVLFVGMGVVLLLFSKKIIVQNIKYNNENAINITINETMKKDIMIYYQIDGFYQNHRRYVNSKSQAQLEGKNISLEDMKKRHECDPIISNKDLNINENKLNPDDIAIPCGLLAKSFILFNDTFNFTYTNDNTQLNVNTTSIARKWDRDRFKNIDMNRQWLDMTDEHFMVWMRPAPFPNFTKLYGRINEDLEAGTQLTIYINHSKYYDKSEINNESNIQRSLILTTSNIFGGKNKDLAVSYLTAGGLCFILGIIIIVGYKSYEQKNK